MLLSKGKQLPLCPGCNVKGGNLIFGYLSIEEKEGKLIATYGRTP